MLPRRGNSGQFLVREGLVEVRGRRGRRGETGGRKAGAECLDGRRRGGQRGDADAGWLKVLDYKPHDPVLVVTPWGQRSGQNECQGDGERFLYPGGVARGVADDEINGNVGHHGRKGLKR